MKNKQKQTKGKPKEEPKDPKQVENLSEAELDKVAGGLGSLRAMNPRGGGEQ